MVETLVNYKKTQSNNQQNNVNYYYNGMRNTNNSSNNLINNVTQISEGLTQSMGIDLQSLLAGMIGAKIVEKKDD